jgi:hypothetical protein
MVWIFGFVTDIICLEEIDGVDGFVYKKIPK